MAQEEASLLWKWPWLKRAGLIKVMPPCWPQPASSDWSIWGLKAWLALCLQFGKMPRHHPSSPWDALSLHSTPTTVQLLPLPNPAAFKLSQGLNLRSALVNLGLTVIRLQSRGSCNLPWCGRTGGTGQTGTTASLQTLFHKTSSVISAPLKYSSLCTQNFIGSNST